MSSNQLSQITLKEKVNFSITCTCTFFVPFNVRLCSSRPSGVTPRLQFEARNQKKEAKEMAVIEAMKRKEQQDQSEAAAQEAH